ncbi:MAG: nucleotide exchange factor GrpE [Microgenomates group bacterium]|jgi:molecular chaperone GrpE|nr:nucleotide exchange factor GrpE [Candidatus Woesebacteria bacterium]MBP6882821.1 nucleotide exchange factor GrpE [Candidatus Woesebacteria bacterium]
MKPKMKQKAHDVMDQLDTELGEVEEAKSVLEVERDEYKNKLLRALADYHNLEKRVADERQELGRRAVQNFILRILPFLDNLEQAEVFVKDKGLEIVKTSFLELLEKEGLKKIDVLNKEYDIHVAEAIDLVEGERDNIVVEVMRNGYKFNGQIVRPAQVKVSKKLT